MTRLKRLMREKINNHINEGEMSLSLLRLIYSILETFRPAIKPGHQLIVPQEHSFHWTFAPAKAAVAQIMASVSDVILTLRDLFLKTKLSRMP